jgi:AcrR family transcriptional regulator
MQKNRCMSSPGLRERKKQKTRWAIQEHALRLFAQHGYDETTVEQIAAAAEISPSTFFRYFKSKEDLIIQDQYDEVIFEAIKAAPPELAPIPAIRHAFRAALGHVAPGVVRESLQRGRLALDHPVVRSKTLESILTTSRALAAALAVRLDRPPEDLRVRALAGACVGAMTEVMLDALGSGAITTREDFLARIDESFDVLENGI